MIHLYCCYTEAHKVLFQEYFAPSLSNNVAVHAYRIDLAGPGDFLSTEFIECIRRKMELILASIDRHWGDIIVWSDVDIIAFGDFEPELRAAFAERPGLDIILQREGTHTTDINAGFFAMRCNPRSRALFEAVKAAMLADPEKNEQPLLNELLFEEKFAIEWAYLPPSFAARSLKWPPPEELRIYHANCTAGADGIRQKHIQFADLKELHPYEKVKVCLVTPELVGPRRNSGIGTHAFYFSRYLAKQPGHEVTVLLSAPPTVQRDPDEASWETYFKEEHNINLVFLRGNPDLYEEVGWFNQWFSLRSQKIYNWLRRQNFDICHFQDLNADGFHCLQARRTGIAFQKCVFTVTVNGPNLWARQGMKQFADSLVDDALINFCESYCLAQADMVIAPSNYALDWCRQAGWVLPAETRVCPYIIEPLEPAHPPGHRFAPASEIIFFGRLETRKGLQIFLRALARLHREGRLKNIRRLHFLGSHVCERDFDSHVDIYEYLTRHVPGLPFTIYEDLDHPQCLQFLRQHKDALVVVPSLAETLGYTVLESLALNLNLVTTKAGAIPEIFENSDNLSQPTAESLADFMGRGLLGELPPHAVKYSRDAAQEAWQAAQEACVQHAEARIEAMEHVPSDPPISVLIPHFNYGPFLEEQLASIAAQTYRNFELIILDDGSTDTASLAIFDRLEKEYAEDTRIRFLRQENTGLCGARNRLADAARHDLLVFCDADNISEPEMLAVFARAIESSGVDCVTCHMQKFRMDGERRIALDAYTPLGACVEAGPFVDPFGDANFIIRKGVFKALGGFRAVAQTASEDWEFLAKLCLQGYQLEVVPQALFQYREHAASNMRQTPFYDTRMRVLQPYLDEMPQSWQRRLLYNAVGVYEREMSLRRLHIPDQPTRELLQEHRDHIRRLELALQHEQDAYNLESERYHSTRRRYARYKWLDRLIDPICRVFSK